MLQKREQGEWGGKIVSTFFTSLLQPSVALEGGQEGGQVSLESLQGFANARCLQIFAQLT